MIATAALQEDVDVVGLSILSGRAHDAPAADREAAPGGGAGDVLVTAGGIIPDDDVPALTAAGVSAVFGPGTTIGEVADVPPGERPPARLAWRTRRRRAAELSAAAVAGRPARPRPAADRRREPDPRRGGRPADASTRSPDGPTSWGSPDRPARASRRSSRRSSPRSARPAGPVAVVAVDPSSPITGGALLGDRVRMQAYADDRDVFIRSMAAARATPAGSPRRRRAAAPCSTRPASTSS